jgi:hypothetical protein
MSGVIKTTGGGGGGSGGGGGGGGGVGAGIEQQGGASCANTCRGVVNPRAKAMVIPNITVMTKVKTPMKIGF